MSSPQDIISVYHRIQPHIHKTPLLSSRLINKIAGCDLYLKCENFQKADSYKIRGATNAILQLSSTQRSRGVLIHSSRNFAQAYTICKKLRSFGPYCNAKKCTQSKKSRYENL